jgi:hypothetical protein
MHLTYEQYVSINYIVAVTSPPPNRLGQTSHELWFREGLFWRIPIEEAAG